MASIPPEFEEILQRHIWGIRRLFKSPRVTIIVRAADDGNAKGDLVLTEDDPIRVMEALRARMIDEAKIFAASPHPMRLITKEASHVAPRVQSDPLDAISKPSGNNFPGRKPRASS